MAKGYKTGGRQPGSLNKVTAAIKELAEPYGPEAIETLVSLLRGAQSERAKVAAAQEILDRAYGKPKQQTELSGLDGADLLAGIKVSFVPTAGSAG